MKQSSFTQSSCSFVTLCCSSVLQWRTDKDELRTRRGSGDIGLFKHVSSHYVPIRIHQSTAWWWLYEPAVLLSPLKKPRKSIESPKIRSQQQRVCVCVTACVGVAMCVCVTEPVCIHAVCICVSQPWWSCWQIFRCCVRADDVPRRPLTRRTRGRIRCCMLNIFYTHACTIRWEVLGGACSYFLCLHQTHLQIYFRAFPGSPSVKEENAGYEFRI